MKSTWANLVLGHAGEGGVGKSSWGYAALAALIVLFTADLATPAGVAQSTLYVLAVLLATLSRNKKLLMLVIAAAIVLAALGYWLQPPGTGTVPSDVVRANRLIAVAAITVTGILGLILLNALHRLSEAHDQIAREQQLVDMAGELAHFGAWALDPASGKLTWSREVFRIHELDADTEPALQEAIDLIA